MIVTKYLGNSKTMTNVELNYDVDVKANLDDLRKTGIIEGQAIDSSVNKNRWQVPDEPIRLNKCLK